MRTCTSHPKIHPNDDTLTHCVLWYCSMRPDTSIEDIGDTFHSSKVTGPWSTSVVAELSIRYVASDYDRSFFSPDMTMFLFSYILISHVWNVILPYGL